MGWYWQHRDKGQSNREYFAKDWDVEILADSTIGGVWYAAVKGDDGDVFAAVYILNWGRGEYNFGYKPGDEGMGPWDRKCPDKVLDLLSPIPDCDHDYDPETATLTTYCGRCTARQWRADCRAYNAAKAAKPKVKAGQIVRFAEPIGFSNGAEHGEFRFVGRNDFQSQGDLRLYRIPGWKERAYEVAS